MKLHKFILTGIMITAIAVGYVHQRIAIIRVGYGVQKNERLLSCLVDRNTKLMYNLSRLESPRNLLTSLSGEEIKFASHRIKQGNSCLLAFTDSCSGDVSESLFGRFLDLFTLSAEAKPQK